MRRKHNQSLFNSFRKTCIVRSFQEVIIVREILCTKKLRSAVASFGADASAKLSNLGAKGEPEDQLRALLERLVEDFAEICGFLRKEVAAVGESSLSELKTRPDCAVTVRQTLVGFIEVKAPGKQAVD